MTFDIKNGELIKVHDCDEHVIIPDSVTKIGHNAFCYCKNLQSVSIPDSVTVIEGGAFYECENLQSVSLPRSISRINDMTFQNCKKLHSVSIPDSVTSIGQQAFFFCNLQSLVLPDSVTSIGDNAFGRCEALQSVSIPDSVSEIGIRAFFYCNQLQSISISPNHPHFFLKDDMLISRNGVLLCALHSITHAQIPDCVTTIAHSAFYACKQLKSVSIPDSVTTIQAYAFAACFALESISVPNSVTTIGGNAFHRCEKMHTVFIPDSVTSIGRNAFAYCGNVQNFRCAYRQFTELLELIVAAEVITCIAPIHAFPEKFAHKVCIGFALNEQKYSKKECEGYFNYIRDHAAEMIDAALKYPELLQLMCREALIPTAVFSQFLDESTKREQTESTAVLLEYQNAHLSEPIGQDLLLDDWDATDSTDVPQSASKQTSTKDSPQIPTSEATPTTEQTGGIFKRLLAWLRRKSS